MALAYGDVMQSQSFDLLTTFRTSWWQSCGLSGCYETLNQLQNQEALIKSLAGCQSYSVLDVIRTVLVQTNCLNNQANGKTQGTFNQKLSCVQPLSWSLQSTLARELLDAVHFQPAIQSLQQPHKHPHSLQLALHIELTHHYIQYVLRRFLQSTVWPHEMLFWKCR